MVSTLPEQTTQAHAEPRTIFQKIRDAHVVADSAGEDVLLYVDRHYVNEVTSPQAFQGLRDAGRRVRRPDLTLAVADHNVPTRGRDRVIADLASRSQVATLERNVADFEVPYVPLLSLQQGIAHVVGPELGMSLPGHTIVCGDSHTSTHGAFGALAFGIGTSDVEHVLATQTVLFRPAKTMLVTVSGVLPFGTTAKDLVLTVIGRVGSAGGAGHVIEYAGPVIEALDMAGRMTVCNMSIEAGARAGLIAPDDTTFAFLRDKPYAPQGPAFDAATERWRRLRSDPGALYDRIVDIDASIVAPMVTWGTNPQAVATILDRIPDPATLEADVARDLRAMLDYMDLKPGTPLEGIPIDVVFIGSCTNSRLEDLRAAADILRGRRIVEHVRGLVVPGSGQVKAAAEAEGLDRTFIDAGFEWRDAGCSMCLGMNEDRLRPGERCASTSNRNFEHRQGTGGRTHLMSPQMAAAAAIRGHITDVRRLT